MSSLGGRDERDGLPLQPAQPPRYSLKHDPLAPPPAPVEPQPPASVVVEEGQLQPAQAAQQSNAPAPAPEQLPQEAWSRPPETAPPSIQAYPVTQQLPPAALPHLPAGTQQIGGRFFAPAGFTSRLRAFMIDFVLLSVLGTMLVWLAQIPPPDPARELELSSKLLQGMLRGQLPSPALADEIEALQGPRQLAGWLALALCATYFVLFQGLAGTTLGKALGGLRVIRRDGRPLGLGLAALRYLVYLLTSKLAYGTFVMPFDAEKRALHDMVSGSNVYRELRWR